MRRKARRANILIVWQRSSSAKRVSAQAKAQEGEGAVEEEEFVAEVIVPAGGGDEGKEIAEDGGSEADDR